MSEEVVNEINNRSNKVVDYVNELGDRSNKHKDRIKSMEDKIKRLYVLVIFLSIFSIGISFFAVVFSIRF